MEDNRKRFHYIILAAVLALVVIYSGRIFQMIGTLWGITIPLVSGCALAYVLNIITVRIESRFFPGSANRTINKIRPFISILLSVLLVFMVISLIINLVVPELARALTIFSVNIPVFINRLISDYESIEHDTFGLEAIVDIISNQQELHQQVINFATRGISGLLTSASAMISGIGSVVFSSFVAFSFAIYILAGRKKLAGQIRMVGQAFIPEKWLERISIVIRTADEAFSSFIVGQVTEAIILGSLCMVGMLLLKIPYATAVGVLIGATALIPIFGAWIGAGIGALLIVAVDPLKALIFLVYIIILQQTENNLIYPRVVGTSIGLPGIWVLAAITVGGGIGGIVGMLISVPVTATIYKLLSMIVRERLNNKD